MNAEPKRAGDRIAECAEHFIGCSLLNRRSELAALVATSPHDDPDQTVRIVTNCAVFARGVMARCGVVHPVLEKRYRIGYAVSDVREIASRHGALETFRGQPLKRGTFLRYVSPGKTNDHIELLLEDVDGAPSWVASHCGGGRDENAITRERSDIRWSWGRPLVEIVDPDLLMEAI